MSTDSNEGESTTGIAVEAFECQQCGEIETAPAYEADRRKYCSNECQIEALNASRKRLDGRGCDGCGLEFDPAESDIKYCQPECYYEDNRKPENRPDGFEALLVEFYEERGHSVETTYRRMNTAIDEYVAKNHIRERLRERGLMRNGGKRAATKLLNGNPEDFGLTPLTTPLFACTACGNYERFDTPKDAVERQCPGCEAKTTFECRSRPDGWEPAETGASAGD